MPLLGVGDGWLVVEDDTEIEEEEEEGEVVVAEEEVGTVPVGVGVASVRKKNCVLRMASGEKPGSFKKG